MLRIAVIFLVASAALPPATIAQSGAERIVSYDVAIAIDSDSTMDVEETIRVHSNGANIRHGILRDFPTTYRDRNGRSYVVGFEVTRVERDGKSEEYSVSNFRNGRRVRIGSSHVNLSPGDYTYVIAYRTDHQLGFFGDHDELYWNATGFWQFPIEHANVRVTLPAGVPADQIRLTAYTGAQGAKGSAFTTGFDPSQNPLFATTAPLKAGEGLTIVVSFPKGFVTNPGPAPQQRATRSNTVTWDQIFTGEWWRIRTLKDAGGIAMASGALILIVLFGAAWLIVGRDPEGHSIPVRYEPPDNMSPAAVRFARVLHADAKGLTASVLSMASKGFLTIEKEKSTYRLIRTGHSANPPLSEEEQAVSAVLFTGTDNAAKGMEQFEDQMAKIQKEHPLLAKLAKGAISMMGPADDANSVTLKPSNPRLLSAITEIRTSLRSRINPKELMKSNSGLIALGVVYSVGVIALCIRVYPGRLAENGGALLGFAILFMVATFMGSMVVANRLAALLPIDSFAPPRSVGNEIANGIGLILAGGFTLAGGWMLALFTSLEFAVAFVAMWLAVGVFQRLLKAPSEKGQQLWDSIEGFRQFLAEVDQDRLNRMNPPQKTPQLFERMLPYAVALECEVAWAKQFESILAMAATVDSSGHAGYAPSWYVGPPGQMLSPSDFASSFADSFGNAISSSSTPPGSSSGAGGGGSSGGGGGGGGGGGW